MNIDDILKQVNDIFIEVLDNDSIKLTSRATMNDVQEWDSLNHAIIISKIEKWFQIKFKLSELMNYKDIGDVCEGIQKFLDLKNE